MNEHDLLADPRRLTPEAETTVAADPKLAHLRQRLLDLDGQLHAAFSEVAPPPGLADRIILHARYPRRSRWLMAAATACVAGLMVALLLPPVAHTPMALAMTRHVAEGADEWADDSGVGIAETQASLGLLGLAYRDAGYRVRRLSLCVVEGRVGRHLVLDTPQGVVSLLVVPHMGNEVRRRETLASGGVAAVVVPAGSVAIGVFARNGLGQGALEKVMRDVFPLLENRA